ncbi:hypothetical protein GLA29479_708 [Lysobacter antibioticus]|uniref:Uncharacterized protein n=1 Tax=Lysobacter antibioticus TaxID=84531 RepID=A0A0S2DSW4_LYSAN|nr:hypothetical protein GLA29479_708 [Lysobacter antibioticus]ALN79723.1 hypothetical protein LA76x_1567 [Lysobacter antibioticus]
MSERGLEAGLHHRLLTRPEMAVGPGRASWAPSAPGNR